MWLKRLKPNINNCARRWIALNTLPNVPSSIFHWGTDRSKSRDDNCSVFLCSAMHLVVIHASHRSILWQRLPLRVPWNGMEAVYCCSVVPFHHFLLCAENCASSSLQPEWGLWVYTVSTGDLGRRDLPQEELSSEQVWRGPSTTADGLVPQRMNGSPVLWSQTVTSGWIHYWHHLPLRACFSNSSLILLFKYNSELDPLPKVSSFCWFPRQLIL